MKTETELLALKKNIDEAKTKVSELKGQLTALLSQLKEWECENIDQAEAKLKEMTEELSNFDSKIALGIKTLEEKYQ